ncbi:hypothetical protein JOL62DRAFT_556017 [Phyllosticta paracitricarpa]|uniref:Uncharacterized protein n=1 Tax=Phyllosticta paracitricarpa TaxID=2016321 RepID=A0ABR1N8R6_9PEZI
MGHHTTDPRNGKRSLIVILRYRCVPPANLTFSPSDAQQQSEQDMARVQRQDSGASNSPNTWIASSPPAMPARSRPLRRRQPSNQMSVGNSNHINGNNDNVEPRLSSLLADLAPSVNLHSSSPSPLPSPSPSQASTEPDDAPSSSPSLSPLAQHIGTLAEPIICQLARAAIKQDSARLEALSDLERQIELVGLNRRTAHAALEKVALEWARKLKEQGGAEGEFVEVERAVAEFKKFKFARLAYIEDRTWRGYHVDGAAGSLEDDQVSNCGEDDLTHPNNFSRHDRAYDVDTDDESGCSSDNDSVRPSGRRRQGHSRSTSATTTTTTTTTTPAPTSAAPTTAVDRSDPSLTHHAPNLYANSSIPSHVKPFVPGRYQHLTTHNPTIQTTIFDQTTRFPLHLPNRTTGLTDTLPLPAHLARSQDWESRSWIAKLNKWHVELLHERRWQPAKKTRHKWTKEEKAWLRAWVGERIGRTGAEGDDGNADIDEALTRDWNRFAASEEGSKKGFRRRDRPVLAESRRRWCVDCGR